jgi:hypothetical protein
VKKKNTLKNGFSRNTKYSVARPQRDVSHGQHHLVDQSASQHLWQQQQQQQQQLNIKSCNLVIL